MNSEILTVLIVLNGSWKQFSLATTSVTRALEVIFYKEMRYINLRFTYLLTYLLTTDNWRGSEGLTESDIIFVDRR